MAKRKTPKVDLKPRAEKISEKHLEKIQNIIKSIDSIQFEIGKLESQKHSMLHIIANHQQELNNMEKELIKEHGHDQQNVIDGSIKYNEENDNNKADKKDNNWKGL